jgi:hypothetical protein
LKNRQFLIITILLDGLFKELDNRLDIFFKERPFLEDSSKPNQILSFKTERIEHELRYDVLLREIQNKISFQYVGNSLSKT